jgi:hypothetical protein
MSDDLQLLSTLRLTAEFLHAQGCGEAATAVWDCIDRLKRPSPLQWELRDGNNAEWRITSVNTTLGYAAITRAVV